MSDCPLCRLERMPEQKVVLESKHCLFLQMPQEILIGSGLIIPKAHRETVFDLTAEEWNDLYHLLGQVKNLLDETPFPGRLQLGLELRNGRRTAHSPCSHACDSPVRGRAVCRQRNPPLAEKSGEPQAVPVKELLIRNNQ